MRRQSQEFKPLPSHLAIIKDDHVLGVNVLQVQGPVGVEHDNLNALVVLAWACAQRVRHVVGAAGVDQHHRLELARHQRNLVGHLHHVVKVTHRRQLVVDEILLQQVLGVGGEGCVVENVGPCLSPHPLTVSILAAQRASTSVATTIIRLQPSCCLHRLHRLA